MKTCSACSSLYISLCITIIISVIVTHVSSFTVSKTFISRSWKNEPPTTNYYTKSSAGDNDARKVAPSKQQQHIQHSQYLKHLLHRHHAHDSLISSEIDTSSNGIISKTTTSPTGLYVHIPFCRRRCRYCNFAIVPIGNTTIQEQVSPSTDTFASTKDIHHQSHEYTDALLSELRHLSKRLPPKSIKLQSIYFGGGTPSLAPVSTFERILDYIINDPTSPFFFESLDGSIDDMEITIEMDPGTFDKEKLVKLRDLGINRISLGVQSFDDTILQTLGRVHTSKDVYQALEWLDEVYNNKNDNNSDNDSGDTVKKPSRLNYSMDLISGLPGQTPAQWIETLQIATLLTPRPTHLSLYDLIVEPGTVFDVWYGEQRLVQTTNIPTTTASNDNNHIDTKNRGTLPTSDEAAWMYQYASGYLRAKGYEHYEISSYALVSKQQDYRSRHNQIYWHNTGQWYAIGMGASSWIDQVNVGRPRTLYDYMKWVKEITNNNSSDESVEKDESTDRSHDWLLQVVLKRLRTREGLDLNWIGQQFGKMAVNAISKGAEEAIQVGVAEYNTQGTLRLTDPHGFVVSNSIISSIYVELDSLVE